MLKSQKLAYFSIITCLAITACDKPTTTLANKELPKNAPIDQLTIEYYANPKNIGDSYGTDECTVKSAQAIIKAGLPFPNVGKAEFTDKDGKGTGQYYETFDYWICGTRYVFPRELVTPGLYPKNSPRNYFKLAGTLPHFWPKGESAGVVGGMSSLVDVRFDSSMSDRFTQDYFQVKAHPYSLQESMDIAKADYEKKKTDYQNNPISEAVRNAGHKANITLNKRQDLKMWEMLYDATNETTNEKSQPYRWQATYWPINQKDYLIDRATGSVRFTRCDTRNDMNNRYNDSGWPCYAGFRINENVAVGLSIYVSHLEEMPNVYNKVQDMVYQAKKLGELPQNPNQSHTTQGK